MPEKNPYSGWEDDDFLSAEESLNADFGIIKNNSYIHLTSYKQIM